MNQAVFESRLLADGHLYCPSEFSQKANAFFKVIVTFEDAGMEISEQDIELAAINDNSTDFLSQEELDYYLGLDEP
ncbi:MAG: hypothetical protein EPN21_19680 [Methylococcaceae bacterium]|nr:MAG: hypothetical protein EPN21_19680 [Methylococcaceae bacterium]